MIKIIQISIGYIPRKASCLEVTRAETGIAKIGFFCSVFLWYTFCVFRWCFLFLFVAAYYFQSFVFLCLRFPFWEQNLLGFIVLLLQKEALNFQWLGLPGVVLVDGWVCLILRVHLREPFCQKPHSSGWDWGTQLVLRVQLVLPDKCIMFS